MKLEPKLVAAIRDLTRFRYVPTSTEEPVLGLACSEVSSRLRDCGWRNVPRIDAIDLRESGFRIVEAQVITGGGRKGRPCRVVVLGPRS